MADKISAFEAYNLKAPKKQARKQVPKKANNGAIVKRQNGAKQTQKAKKMSTASNSSGSNSSGSSASNSSGSNISGSSSNEVSLDTTQDVGLETTADLVNLMAQLIDKNDNVSSDDDDISHEDAEDNDNSDEDSDDDHESGDTDSDGDYDDESAEDDDSQSETDGGSQSEIFDSSNQFSEYTLSHNSTTDQSSPSETVPAAERPTARKRHVEAGDPNNNRNNPSTAKLLKLQQEAEARQQQIESMSRQQQKAAAQMRAAADPQVRATATAKKVAAKSCPLPAKEAAVKFCPLAPKVKANKMADEMAAKSCPLPKKSKSLQKQDEEANNSSRQKAKPDQKAAKSCPLPKKSTLQPKQQEEEEEEEELDNAQSTEKASEQLPRREVHMQSSIEEGKRALLWLMHPVSLDDFFSLYWEKNACQVKRKCADYFSQLISFKKIDKMMIENHLEFTTNIDVTSYENGERQTHNPDGRAMPPAVWGYYGDGCSVRILNPSTYLRGLRVLCTVLQEYFHCLVGANVYLTPPNSQGFAPHYDDIEAFVLQVEGRKRWRLYTPPLPSDTLARVSSGNYKQEQLGEPIFDEVLEPGDILYFPRGTVHQAVTEKQHHSLHITLSVYQQQSYANLLENLMPAVLQRAIKHHLNLRRGLPLHAWGHLGIAHGDKKTEQRAQIVGEVKQQIQKYLLPTESQIDAAFDQLAKRYQHEALPPVVLPEEHERTVFGSRSQTDEHGNCLCDYEITEQTRLRLLRANILRLVAEENTLRVYYYVDNALEYCKYEPNYMEIKPTEAAVIEAFINAYPKYLDVSVLPLRSAKRRIEVATALWERGLLMTEKPFK